MTSVTFRRFKALGDFTARLSRMNVLVGPNNCGKSTAIGAFRVLALAIRRARSRRSELLMGPTGRQAGWQVSEEVLPISIENIHTDYADEDTTVEFKTSNRGSLTLFFPRRGGCLFFAEGPNGTIRSPAGFRDLPIDGTGRPGPRSA